LKKNILEVINDEGLIKNLYKKTSKIKINVLNFNNKLVKLKQKMFWSVFPVFLGFSTYISADFLNKLIEHNININGGIEPFIVLIIALLIIFSGVSSHFLLFLIKQFNNLKIKRKDDSFSKKQFNNESIETNKRINNFIFNFEKSLNKKEVEYLQSFYFFQSKDEEYINFTLYSWSLHNTNINCILDNKKLLINNIQNKFNINNQKELLRIITKIIQNNNVDKELNDLELAVNNVEIKKIVNKKVNKKVVIKNI
jgi:hypothetical protein